MELDLRHHHHKQFGRREDEDNNTTEVVKVEVHSSSTEEVVDDRHEAEDRATSFDVTSVEVQTILQTTAQVVPTRHLRSTEEVQVTRRDSHADEAAAVLVTTTPEEETLGLQRSNPMFRFRSSSTGHLDTRPPLIIRETCRAQAGAPRTTVWAR